MGDSAGFMGKAEKPIFFPCFGHTKTTINRNGGIVMCTAAAYQTRDFYFGRTLDYDCSYGEEVTGFSTLAFFRKFKESRI